MNWVSFGGNCPDESDTFSPTGYSHSNAAGAERVGAAFYQDSPRFGSCPAQIEPFSSAGGAPILFDTAGNRPPEPGVRLKPGITAPDGTNTTFFGFDVEPDGFPNFFGTAAAAPHAAAGGFGKPVASRLSQPLVPFGRSAGAWSAPAEPPG